HESYQQGVIGLVAGKLVDEFYRPAIVVAKGDKYSKASARSVSGFNMIEFIRTASELLVDVGGHPMAAGFTVETEKLLLLQEKLEELAEKAVGEDLLARTLRIDCEIKLSDIIPDFYEQLQTLEPFGMGNPQPTFVSRGVTIEDMRLVGADSRHLKLRISQQFNNLTIQQSTIFDAIAFGLGERAGEFHIGDKVDIVYTIEQDTWNGNSKLQLKIKDIQR
ncbi:single-stranded-DNA-specific exonuclease RecJ, partial [Candidatus Microgenomates bacterium]|nr:single-stranded-DNA-specific exonuclease RecJ [Candidatus Microgenomates bacterium]